MGKKRIQPVILCAVIVVFSFPHKHLAQTYESQRNQLFAYNILFNGFVGGIGGAINRQDNEKIIKAFGRNFLRGSLGGFVKYTAKYEIYSLRTEQMAPFAKPNRLLFFLGHSFVNNASLNRGLFDSFQAQFYGFHFDVNLKNKVSVNTRISVFTLAYTAYFLSEGNKFNLGRSIAYGVFYFDQRTDLGSERAGSAGHNVLVISPAQFLSIPHEIVHTYQFFDFLPLSNLFFHRRFTGAKSTKTYTALSKYFFLDIPYSHMLYHLQPEPAHYHNFFEFEAEHFASRRYIDR